MKKFPLRLLFPFLLIVLASVAPALAKEKKAKGPQYHLTVISSVSPNSITIAEDKVMRTFAITQFIEITVKGQRATLADLQPGMAVSVTLGTDPSKLSRISAGDPPMMGSPKK